MFETSIGPQEKTSLTSSTAASGGIQSEAPKGNSETSAGIQAQTPKVNSKKMMDTQIQIPEVTSMTLVLDKASFDGLMDIEGLTN